MMRIDGWETKLSEGILSGLDKPFVWGAHDCVSWTMGIIQDITGIDYYDPFKGRYTSQEEAHALIRSMGATLEDVASMTFNRIHLHQAGRGDLVMYQGALGICDGVNSFFLTEFEGVKTIKTLHCQAAWRVG